MPKIVQLSACGETDRLQIVDAVGANVSGFTRGDEVLGWTEQRAAQAEYVAVSPLQLTPKPPALEPVPSRQPQAVMPLTAIYPLASVHPSKATA